MDDERVVSRLRQVADPASPDPAFLERMYEELAEELRFRPAHQSGVRPSHSRMARRLILLAAAAVLTLSIVGGALLVGAIVDRERRPDATPALLERLREAGVIRIAVRPDRPQVATPGGATAGFDVDVAIEIGRRLGLRVELDFTPADEMLAGRGDWDIALPSSAVEPGSFATTSPILRLAGPAHRPRGIHGSRTRRLVGIDDLRRHRKRRRGLARWAVPRHECDSRGRPAGALGRAPTRDGRCVRGRCHRRRVGGLGHRRMERCRSRGATGSEAGGRARLHRVTTGHRRAWRTGPGGPRRRDRPDLRGHARRRNPRRLLSKPLRWPRSKPTHQTVMPRQESEMNTNENR